MSKRLYHQCLQIAKNNIHRCTEINNHFSFIIQNNTIIGWGYNRRGTVHKKFGYKWYSNIHSEVDATAKCLKRIDKSKAWKLVNIRLNNQLETLISKPCTCCEQFISILGCNKIFYSTEIAFSKLIL